MSTPRKQSNTKPPSTPTPTPPRPSPSYCQHHPSYGGQGQARLPKYAVGDVFRLVAPTTTVPTSPLIPRSTSGPFTTSLSSPCSPPSGPPAASTRSNTTASAQQREQAQLTAAKSVELIPDTAFRITHIKESASDKVEHMYSLEQTTMSIISVGESRIVGARFGVGDVVKLKDNGGLRKVKEVKVVRGGEGGGIAGGGRGGQGGRLTVVYALKDEVGGDSVVVEDGGNMKKRRGEEW